MTYQISNGVKKIFIGLFIVVIVALILNFNLTGLKAKTSQSVNKVKSFPVGLPAEAIRVPTIQPVTTATAAKPAAEPIVKPKPAAVTIPAVKPATKTVAKPKTVAVTHTSKYKTTMKWDATGLKYLANSASFDYSSAIRNAVIKKVENYAKRNHIKVITRKVIDNMRE